MSPRLRTNETKEAISALEMIAETAKSLGKDRYRWKWTIIATHNALQGFMILALQMGNGLLVLKENIAAQWLKALREGGQYPTEKLDSFLNLYKKIKSDLMLRYENSKKFEAKPNHDRAVERLNELRNDFIHFVPKGWCLELTGLPEICLSCLEIMEFLGWESENVSWYDETHEKRAILALKEAKQSLTKIKQKYEEEGEDVGMTPLMIAAQEGETKIVKVLLAIGSDINAKDNDGVTALMIAADEGHTEIVKALLAGGADVNRKANDGRTALTLATSKDSKEIVQLLKQ